MTELFAASVCYCHSRVNADSARTIHSIISLTDTQQLLHKPGIVFVDRVLSATRTRHPRDQAELDITTLSTTQQLAKNTSW